MPKPTHHILVCTTKRPAGNPRGSCGEKNSPELIPAFYQGMEKHELYGQILVTESSCLGPCPIGATVVVYPEGIWYKKITVEDVATIMEEHIVGGKPVEALMVPEEMWG